MSYIQDKRRRNMIVAVVGSRSLVVDDMQKYLPEGVTEIVSGGADGIDTCAREYAVKHNIRLTEFLPEYNLYGRAAPIKRNIKIIDHADLVIALWDGCSKGTEFVIRNCRKIGKPIVVYDFSG